MRLMTMIDDFRQQVIHTVFVNFNKLTDEQQRHINSLVRKNVKVQGFRNSALAPMQLKINGCVETFRKSHQFVAQILSAWCKIYFELRKNIYDFLVERTWPLLPIDTDRSLLPGFMVEWPADEKFEVLTQTFREKFSDSSVSDDDISLMIVWLSNHLPYEMVEKLFQKNNETL